MKKYRVLWIDNDYDKFDAILTEMEQADLDVTCYKTAKQGVETIKNRLYYWDGVILDAKVFDETEHEADTLAGMTRVITAISELKSERVIPLFILTGQPDTKGDQAFEAMLKGFNLRAYSKNTERKELYLALKGEADRLPETQLRHKYNEVFIDDIDEKLLIDILAILDNGDFKNDNIFNLTRKMFECTLPLCKEIGLFSTDIYKVEKGKESLKESKVVPLHIKYIIDSFVASSQDGSHYEQLSKDVDAAKYPYIVPATIYSLLTYIHWLDRFRKGEKTK